MKIVVAGYFGHQNLGDESILFSIASELKEHDLTIISLDPASTEKNLGVPAVNFFDLEALEDSIAESAFVIVATGGAYQEIPGIPYYQIRAAQFFSNPYGHPDGNLTAYGIAPLLASFYNKILVFLDIGLGPFYSQPMKHFCSFLFTSADLVTVRDQYSYEWARNLAPNSNVHLAADAAFVLTPQKNTETDSLLNKYGLESKQFIVLSLRELLDNSRQQKIVAELAKALPEVLAELKHLKILFLPFQNMLSDYPVTDKNMALQLLKQLDQNRADRIVICEDQLAPQAALDLISHGLFGIGMRYHFLLFCVLNEIPAISISYDNKCKSLMNDAGILELAMDISELRADLITSKIHALFKKYDMYCKLIHTKKIELRKRASRSFELFYELLKTSNTTAHQRRSKKKQIKQTVQFNSKLYSDLDLTSLFTHLQQEQENERIDKLERELNDRSLIFQAEVNAKEAAIEKLKQENDEQGQTIQKLHNELVSAKNSLNLISSSLTWRLGQIYGKFFYNTSLNTFIENLCDKFLLYRRPKDLSIYDFSSKENFKVANKLKELTQQIQSRGQKGIFIITSTFQFDEFYNQRAINLSKFLAKEDNCVIYIAWRWSKSEGMTGTCQEVYQNIFQIPVDYFLNQPDALINLVHTNKWFIVEFPHPSFYPIMLQMKGNGYGILYDIIDNWKEFNRTGQAPWFRNEIEKAILLNSDVVTSVSPTLIKNFSASRVDIKLVRNGFSQELLGIKPAASSKNSEAPICIGYFGHLTESWFDWDFIFEMARDSMDFRFQIIGYGESSLTRSKASRFDNIDLLGKVHPSSLNQHVTNWDVAIIPFVQSPLSESVDPIKIYEYLYFGLPVIVKGISHLSDYPNVKVCRGSKEVQQAIRRFARMKRNGEIDSAAIGDFLKTCTWEERFKLLVDHLRCEIP